MSKNFLFEISWEVCNKVGGIYAALHSKIGQAINYWGENYILIGPWRKQNTDFVEVVTPFFDEIKQSLLKKGIKCKVGYWDTVGKPKVILVDFNNYYDTDILFYSLWKDFGVGSTVADNDYQDPVLFGAIAGEIIDILSANGPICDKKIIAHFHEWMSGAGILHLKKHNSGLATIFTTHATVMGRALAYDGLPVYSLPNKFDVNSKAHKYRLFAKHSMEKAAAHNASYFTTVSGITAEESKIVLAKLPDKVVWNGLDIAKTIAKISLEKIPGTRNKLIQIAREITGRKIADNALLWASSGRYEFHNKGYDVLLKSLAKLEEKLPCDSPPIVLFLLVAANWHAKKDSLLEASSQVLSEQSKAQGISTHRLRDPKGDSVVKLCNQLGFKKPHRKIHVVFSNVYLNGQDGVFNLFYEQILASCDRTIFPSFYEPWGYTPLESLAYSTPTVTTDLAGFGDWVSNNVKQDYSRAVFVLKRKGVKEQKIISDLSDHLCSLVVESADSEFKEKSCHDALQVAYLADWQNFYQGYLDVYENACNRSQITDLGL